MNTENLPADPQERAADQQAGTEDATAAPAWEQIEPGRFMPRRVRGSYRGGKLG
jgi:hypothetical protein